MDKKKDATYPIRIPSDVVEDLKARNLNISEVIRTSLHLAKLKPKYLYEVSMSLEDSFYYVVVDNPIDTLVIREMMRLDYFLLGSKVHGLGEYAIRLVGAFPNKSDASLYAEFLMNKCLDKGCYLVNEFFQRYVSLRLDLTRISKVIETNVDLSILVEEVISIIESSNRSSFSDKLDDSMDLIISKVKNSI